jgi:Uma2 family endonuclease
VRCSTASRPGSGAFSGGVTVEAGADTDYVPDAVVNADPRLPPDATAAPNPVILVEVPSPVIQSINTGEKPAN